MKKLPKIWKEKEIDKEKVKQISEKYGVNRFIAKILSNREFLLEKFGQDLTLKDLSDPFLFSQMEDICKRIEEAIDKKQKVLIYGDFDADGVTATTVLYKYLLFHGIKSLYYIPNRVEEGYGLGETGIKFIIENKPDLVITVDNGITAHEQIEEIKNNNIDVIVTDHHELEGKEKPDCLTLNPKIEDKVFSGLSGVGVVFKLVSALNSRAKEKYDTWKLLPYVMIGTIADVCPMMYENRIIAKLGFFAMKKSDEPAFIAMKDILLKNERIDETAIGYKIAPCINASGRLGSSDISLDLFLSDNLEESKKLVNRLIQINNYRQALVEEVYKQAENQAKEYKDDSVLVLSDSSWHIGIIGIVANKIAENFNKPTYIMVSDDDGLARGSARSYADFDVFNSFEIAKELLITSGGHKLAGGFSLKSENINKFRELLNEIKTDSTNASNIEIEFYLSNTDISYKNFKALNSLSPFGAKNEKPVFGIKQVRVLTSSAISEGKHLKLRVDLEGTLLDCLYFYNGKLAEKITSGDFIDLAGRLNINRYNGKENLQMIITDIRVAH